MEMFHAMKVIAKGVWAELPEILSGIPQTEAVGKILAGIKKAAEEAMKEGVPAEKGINQFIEENGGKAKVQEKMYQTLESARGGKMPKFINCAIFTVREGGCMSEAEQQKLVDTLIGEQEADNAETQTLVQQFISSYFGENLEACDNPIEIDEDYIAFNFDDCADHKYSIGSLEDIMEMLNKILGSDVFSHYEGMGTDDSVGL